MSLLSELTWGRTEQLSQEALNRRAKITADAIETLRSVVIDWEAAVRNLNAVGLQRINDALIPAYEQVRDLADLGGLLSATSSSPVEIGAGTKSFVLPENKRLNFAPTLFLIASANGDYDLSMTGRLASYDKETGVLVMTVDAFRGEGAFTDWVIGPIANTEDLEALRAQVITSAAEALTNKETAVAAAASAGTSETNANAARIAAQAALATFQASYFGARNTEPDTDELGAQYLDTSQTPNVVKVLTESGWAPTVTISIGGSRQQSYVATAGQTGPFVVDGGFTQGSVNINGAELFDGNGIVLDPIAGSFTVDSGLKEGDLVVFRGYLANDAADIYTKSEADQRFLTGKQTQVFTEAEKGQARANAGAGILAGFRNKIINGNFDIWQRATDATSGGGYMSADRWFINGSGATVSFSRLEISPQPDVPQAARYRGRLTAQTADDNIGIWQRIEGVRTLAAKRATLTFWYRSNEGQFPSALRVFIRQKFGTGGSPSADAIVNIDLGPLPISVNWQKFTRSFDIPSIIGKTLGTNGDDHLQVSVENSANEMFVFDIARVSLVEGDATTEADPFEPRHHAQELSLCQRYYEVTDQFLWHGETTSSQAVGVWWPFRQKKRAFPSVITTAVAQSPIFGTTISVTNATTDGANIRRTSTAAGYGWFNNAATADAEL